MTNCGTRMQCIHKCTLPFPGLVRGTRMQCIHEYTLPYIVQREQYSVVMSTVVSQPRTCGYLETQRKEKYSCTVTCTIQMAMCVHTLYTYYMHCVMYGNSVMGTGILQVAAGCSALIKATFCTAFTTLNGTPQQEMEPAPAKA